MPMTVGVIVNPAAGRGYGREQHPVIIGEFEKRGIDFVDFTARSMAEAEARARVAIAGGNIDAIVVAGGDGMAHLGVNLAMEFGLKFGIIPCGTGNDTARAFGIPIDDPHWATQIVLDHINLTRRIDVGHARTNEREFYFIGSIAAGLDSIVNARANKMRFPKGPSRYKFALYRELLAFKPIRYKLVVDGEYHETQAMLCSVTNVPSYGGGMLVTPEAKINDGKLDLFIVHKISKAELTKVFPHVYTGTHVEHPQVEIVPVTSVSIDAGNTPVFADGEPAGRSPLEVKVVPNGLEIMAPAPVVG
jgi:diacylglycerol kinase (ATP)